MACIYRKLPLTRKLHYGGLIIRLSKARQNGADSGVWIRSPSQLVTESGWTENLRQQHRPTCPPLSQPGGCVPVAGI